MSTLHPSLRRRSPLRRSTSQRQRWRLPPVNRARLARVREQHFGPPERRAWVASLPCATCGRRATEHAPNHNSHVRHSGGGPDDVISQCWGCHVALHAEGVETFCSRRNSTREHLHRIAEQTAAAWREVEAARTEGPP